MDSVSCIKKPIATELEEFKTLFENSLTSSNTLLNSVIAHIRKRTGKMMRPILTLLTARIYGPVEPATLHTAVALELLHTASLVHDDVVDESNERRGQPSVNAIFNNKISVLSGDYLLATSLLHAEQTKSHEIIETVSRLGQELSEGELLQLANIDNTDFLEEVYFDVIRKKTAALFAACTKAAAYSVGVDKPEEVEAARQLGECIGICFQIKDDIFDYYDSKAIGKPTGNDMLEGKLTLPALYLLNHTDHKEAHDMALKVKKGTANEEDIHALIELTKAHGGIEYALQAIETYRQKTLALLGRLPHTDVRHALEEYVNYVVNREK